MKYTLFFLIILLSSCHSKVSNNHAQSSSNNNLNPDKSELICKTQIVTGSRRHVKICLTKEQRDIERRESQNAIRNATDRGLRTPY